MSNPYLGEIRIFPLQYAPRGWALCNGQLLAINQNQALFSVLGTTYGGNGINNFALPNLQGRLPLHLGNGFILGQSGGEAAHTLLLSEIPAHNHGVNGSTTAASQGSPSGNLWGTGNSAYLSKSNTSMNPSAIANSGGNQPHQNMPPYLTLTICIALTGIFPSRG